MKEFLLTLLLQIGNKLSFGNKKAAAIINYIFYSLITIALMLQTPTVMAILDHHFPYGTIKIPILNVPYPHGAGIFIIATIIAIISIATIFLYSLLKQFKSSKKV